MADQRTTSKVLRTAALALLLAGATIRGTTTARADVAEPVAPTAVAATVDRGARQIVANHPTIPVPSAAWPAMLGVAFVARRAIGVAARGR